MKNFKQNIKQSWQIIKQNKFFSSIYILGTALSISMIMVVAMAWLFKTADIYPETNRSRMMIFNSITEKEDGRFAGGASISHKAVESLIKGVDGVECITETSDVWDKSFAQRLGEKKSHLASLKYVDYNFWKVFEFEFIEGMPYSEEEELSQIKKIVVSESFAKKVFNKTNVVGERLKVEYVEYTICGVVKTPSYIASESYSEVWVPITFSRDYFYVEEEGSGFLGELSAYILLENSSKTKSVYNQINERVTIYNNVAKDGYTIDLGGQPDTYYINTLRKFSRVTPARYIWKMGAVLLALLLIPTLNLSGMISSRMYRRMEEIGIRKTFGASKASIMSQIINENMLLSLMGGGLGLVFSYLLMAIGGTWIFSMIIPSMSVSANVISITYSAEMLLDPMVFIIALLVSIVLNTLSAVIPARYALKRNIIDSLNTIAK